MGETPSVVPLPDGGIAATTLRRRRHTDSTPRASPRTPVRDALSLPRRAHLAVVVDVALSRGPQSSRTRVGPFAGDERCVHHRSRVFVTRSPVGRRALASSSREPPLREPSASCVLVIERCVRPTSAHPRILKRAPIVSCGDRVSSAHSGGMSFDTTSSSRSRDRCGRRFHDAVRASVARVRGRPGVFFPCSARSCAPPLTPLSPSPEPRVAISREIKLRVRPRPFRFRTS